MGAGLTAAGMIATVPILLSRSVAGSYDNGNCHLLLLLTVLPLDYKSVKTGITHLKASLALLPTLTRPARGEDMSFSSTSPHLMHLVLMIAEDQPPYLHIAFSTVSLPGNTFSIMLNLNFVGFQPVCKPQTEHTACTWGLWTTLSDLASC